MALQRKPETRFNPASATIMVIDDNQFCRTTLAEVLRALGVMRVHQFRDAATALSEIAVIKPTIICCDMMMPDVSGLDFTKRVRAEFAWPLRGTPVIMVSGSGTPEKLHEARWAGVDEFIIKPFSAAAVLRRLEEVMVRPRPFVQSPKYVGPCRRRKLMSEGAPQRRLDDPIAVLSKDEEAVLEAQKQALKQEVVKLASTTRTFNPSDRTQVRSVYSDSKATHAIAVAMKDAILGRATQSLVSYIESLGAAGGLDGAVVQTHLAAILELAKSPLVVDDTREGLAQGLEKIVAKRIAAAAAA